MNQVNKKDTSHENNLRRRGRSSSVADLHASRISAEFTKSKFMEIHDKKISELLGYDEKQYALSRYLRMKNKLGLNYLKPEVEGLGNEKDQVQLTIQDQKKKLIYDKEEITIMKMQNNEYRRMIAELEQDKTEVKNK